MRHRRTTGLLAGLIAAVGCAYRGPDMRDFNMQNLPPVPADARTAAIVQEPAKPPEPAAKTPVPKAEKAGVKPGQLDIPPELPGSEAPAIPAGPNPTGNRFPALPAIPQLPEPAASPTGKPLTLADLEQMALANNPTVRQAAADVEAARGRAIQAGLYPNPEVGYQVDQLNSGRGYSSRGQQGMYFSFSVITAGKLTLARLAQMMDYYSAQVALRRAQIDLVNQVRSNYFAFLVAREAVTVNGALARFTERLYVAQQGLVKGGEQAAYEPLQSYVLALQARGYLIQAQNRYSSTWRQLAASLSRPDLPVTEVAGRADAAVPQFDYDKLLAQVLENHTDLQTAHNAILRARYQLRLAVVQPVPDLKYYMYIERDWSTPPFNTQVGIQAGGPIPVFDRNQGGRLTAKAELARAIQDVQRVRNDLATRLAQAYETYTSSKVLVGYYRDAALPMLVQAYRGVYQRYMVSAPGAVSYNDVVVAQQNLATGLAAYLTALGSQWQAVVDLATLAQTDELYLQPPAEGGGWLDQLFAPKPGEPAVPVGPGAKPKDSTAVPLPDPKQGPVAPAPGTQPAETAPAVPKPATPKK